MTTETKFVDTAGDEILHFISDTRNLTELGGLTRKIVDMAKSDNWRRYRTAVGKVEWLEAEFDYFLIACDLPHREVMRVLAYDRESKELASLMDHKAEPSRRRSLEEASAEWKAPTPGTLIERAQRLGWTRTVETNAPGGKRVKGVATPFMKAPPVSERARLQHRDGLTNEQRARRNRVAAIPEKRRTQLDSMVEKLSGQLTAQERRYLMDRLLDIDKSLSS